LLAFGGFLGCKPEPKPTVKAAFELNVVPLWGTQTLEVGQTYEYAPGKLLRPDQVKFYLSNIRLVRPDGSELLLKEIMLVDMDNEKNYTAKTTHGTTPYFFQADIPEGEYTGIRFNIGVPPAMNAKAPYEYPNNHPLSVGLPTWWTWATGYRFVTFDGRLDTTDGTFTQNTIGFSYHPGTDALLAQHSYVGAQYGFTTESGFENRMNLEVDFRKMFYPEGSDDFIYIEQDPITHTLGSDFPLAQRAMNNLGTGVFVFPEKVRL
jgi:hypothetical protein